MALFVASAVLYFAVGYLLVMRYTLFDPDAISRVANAGYVLHSRDPHLSAVGFVWNPLPSLVELPVLLFARWWPALSTHGLAGVVQSALFMSGSTVMVRRIALDRGVGSGWRGVAIACFALQPMIVLYGASGMSEAAELFCALWCARHLMRWADTRRTAHVAWAAIALAVGYLARYEIAPAALGAATFVAFLAGGRAVQGSKAATALGHFAIMLFPITLAAGLWALTGWVINNDLFAPITSQYGNASQVGTALEKGYLVRGSSSEWLLICARLLGMQPFAGIAAVGAVAYAVCARRPATLVPVVVFAPVLAFAAWGQYTSTTFGWFRFYLLAIPMVVCIALACWSTTRGARPPWRAGSSAGRLGAVLLCLSIVVGFPVTARAALNERIGNPPFQAGFNSLLHPQRYPAQEVSDRQLMVNDQLMAAYLDRHRLAGGSVLMDTAYTWGVWLSSTDPGQFVITSDYDFKAALNRPWRHGVRYFLASNPAFNAADALNIRYPTLWDDGAGIGTLVYSVDGPTGDQRFRLYEITEPKRSTTEASAPGS